jgi:glycerol uptake facilitator protein
MHSLWLGEFMGTAVLLLFGNGVCANVTLRKSYAADAGWMVVTTGWALGVLCGVIVAQAFGSPGAHLNPAISLASAIISGDYSLIPVYWSAQLLGAMCGATLAFLHFGPHWALTPDPAAKLGIFCTNGAVRNPLANLFSEALGTGMLVLIAGAIFSRGVSATGPAPGLGQWLVASLVWGIGLSLGGTTGYAINPARDFGPRLIHALLPIPGKGGSNWSYAWIPIVGDLTGGALARWKYGTQRVPDGAQALRRKKFYSKPEATTDNAAIAAVSARRMRGPSVAAFHALASNSASSAGAHPPSGPMAISSTGISSPADCTASSTSRRSVVVRSCSARTMRVAFDAAFTYAASEVGW